MAVRQYRLYRLDNERLFYLGTLSAESDDLAAALAAATLDGAHGELWERGRLVQRIAAGLQAVHFGA